MHKAISLFAFTFSLSTVCSAQDYYMPRNPPPPPPQQQQIPQHYHPPKDTQKMFFVEVSIGVSVPTGGFSEKDTSSYFMIPTNNDTTHAKGFANVGFHINAKGGIYLTPYFGLLAKVGLSYNSFDANALNSIINGAYYYSIDGSYQVWQFMGGAFLNIPLNPETSLRLEGMLGDITTGYPSSSVSDAVQTISFKLSNASDFAYSLSVGFEQVISPAVSFVGSLTYTGAELSYPTCTYTFSGTVNGSYIQHYPVSMSYGSLDFTAGLLFHL